MSQHTKTDAAGLAASIASELATARRERDEARRERDELRAILDGWVSAWRDARERDNARRRAAYANRREA